MKTLTQLTATPVDTDYREPHGVRSAVLHEPVDGWFVHIKLGGAGVTISHGKDIIAIPLAELVALAQQHAPELLPAATVPDPAPETKSLISDLRPPTSA
jgi:hypothetical protein